MGIILGLIVGGIVGWLASIVMKANEQMGILANVLVGIAGSAIGQFVFGLVGFAAHGMIASLIVAIAGASLLIAGLRALGFYK